MTPAEAMALKSFGHPCNCGGYAGISDRSQSRHPHMFWCAQFEEWEEWRAAMELTLTKQGFGYV